MSNKYRFLVALAAVIGLAGPAAAQQSATTEASPTPEASTLLKAPVAAPQFSLEAPAETAATETMTMAAARRPASSTTLMIVGGAAILVGAVVGGDAGNVIMVGGAVIGLIGLYNYLR